MKKEKEKKKKGRLEMGFFAVILFGLLIWLSEMDWGKCMSYIGAAIMGLAIIISLFQFIF